MKALEFQNWSAKEIARDICLISFCGVLVLLGSGMASAVQGIKSQGYRNSRTLPPLLRNIGIDQKLNNQVPLDLVFRDENGNVVRLGKYFGKKPVILSLVYFNCPSLCTTVVNDLTDTLRQISFNIGKQYSVLTVSFDPTDTPAAARAKKAVYISRYGRPGAGAGWHFLTGEQTSIHQLTQAVGFRYNYDPATHQYYHATGIMVLTPKGRISSYFYGIKYPPGDLRLSLVEASGNKIGSPVDEVLLLCCRYNPAQGTYDVIVSRVLAIAGVFTLLLLGALFFVMFRHGRGHQEATS